MLDNLLDLLLSFHGTQVEGLDNWACGGQLGCVVWGRRKLLDHLAAHAGGGLLPAHNRAVAKIALNKEHHLLVADQDIVAANDVEPTLER